MVLDKELIPVLAVALLTWGGVFFYLLRLDLLTRAIEKEVNRRDSEASGGK